VTLRLSCSVLEELIAEPAHQPHDDHIVEPRSEHATSSGSAAGTYRRFAQENPFGTQRQTESYSMRSGIGARAMEVGVVSFNKGGTPREVQL
jgi:hypothetical protein